MSNESNKSELTRESCIEYVLELGYYSRETIESLWVDDDPEKFFSNYVSMKHDEEIAYPCMCGNSTVMAHPYFGVTFGFGVAGACTCDGEANLEATPLK